MDQEPKTPLPKFTSHDSDEPAPGALPSAFRLFEPSQRTVRKNLLAYLVIAGVPILIGILYGYVGGSSFRPGSTQTHSYDPYSFGLLALLLGLAFLPVLIGLQLKTVRGQRPTIGEAFNQSAASYLRVIGLVIVMVIMLAVAFILLIVPVFFVLPRVILAPYFLVDHNVGIFGALRASNEAYKKHHGVWGVLGVLLLLDLPRIIPIVGPIVGGLLGFVYSPALAMRYEQLQLLDAGKPPQTAAEAELTAEAKQ